MPSRTPYPWDRVPLVGRLLFTTALALLIAGLVLLYSTVRRDAEEAHAGLREQMAAELRILPAYLAELVVIGDFAAAQQTLNLLVQRPLLSSLSYQDHSGAKLVSSDRPLVLTAPTWFAKWLGLSDQTSETEILVGGHRYGSLTITLSARPALNRTWSRLVQYLSILALAIMLDFVGIWLVLRNGLRPLKALNEATQALQRGDFNARVPLQGSPELRRPMAAFNQMADTIADARQHLMAEKERLQVTLASIGDAVITTDADGRILYMNPVAEQLTGWPKPEARGHMLPDMFHLVDEASHQPTASPLDQVLTEGCRVENSNHTLIIARDGKEHPVTLSAAPILSGDGFSIHGAVLVLHDQTRERQYLDHLRLSASVFEHAQEGIIITGLDGRILDVNPAFSQVTGYSREEVTGQRPSMLSSGVHDPTFYAEMWSSLSETGSWRGEIWNRKKDGELFAELLAITRVPAGADGRGYFVGVFSDITELKAQQQHLERLAHYDALTRLPNRVLLADRLHVALAEARRHGRMLAVCYLDLDGFKPINDSYGHVVGDQLLVEVANRLTQSLRETDTVGRLGGDEFVVLLGELDNMADCRLTLERLLRIIANPYTVAGERQSLSASIGVAVYPLDDTDSDTLLRHADQAMYAAKEAGRNRYHLFDAEQDRHARSQRQTMKRIQQGLAKGEFKLHYQPKVDMRLGQVIGVEALVRWHHTDKGLLLPNEFLPIIAETELAIPFGNWVVESALAQMAAWRRAGLALSVSVNIAARQLQSEDFAAELASALDGHPEVPPSDLELEILESSALDDLAHVTLLIKRCQELGVSFALDDFGTGYSSLTYFKRLPAHTLKIDQSFVRDMLVDAEDLAIIDGIIGLAKAFGRRVIAEGVEDIDQGRLLLYMGCDLAQGYAIARPMPAKDLPGWIATWQLPDAWRDAAQVGSTKQGRPLLVAGIDLKRWTDAFAAWISSADGAAIEPLPLHSQSCRFTRWYENQGRETYGNDDIFLAIAPIQQQAQALATELGKLKAANHLDLAEQRLPELFQLRDKLLDLLEQLRQQPKQTSAPPN